MAGEFWTGAVMVPDRRFTCADCHRDLWLESRRRRNPNACPTVWIGLDGRTRCTRCDDRHHAKEELQKSAIS